MAVGFDFQSGGRTVSDWVRDDYCFVCGKKNPYGLKLEIKTSPDGKAEVEFVPAKEYQGYGGILHGGIAATLLDEIMVYAAYGLGKPVATVKLTVKYRKPVPIGRKIRVEGEVTSVTGRKVQARGKILDADGKVLVEAQSLMYEVKAEDLKAE